MPSSTTRLALAIAAVLLAACPSSSNKIPDSPIPDSPTTDSPTTEVTVGGYRLVPHSAAIFSGDRDTYFDETIVMVSDHPDTCGEIAKLDVCDPAADLFVDRIIDPPPAVMTALVVSAHPAEVGTFGIGAQCYLGRAAKLAFVVHDAAGKEVVHDDAVQGTVSIDALEPGVEASGNYDVVLRSGAKSAGRFAGTVCTAISAFAVVPPPRICSGGGDTSTHYGSYCTCRGETVSSDCTRATTADPWTCTCTDAAGVKTTCTMPADAPEPATFCFQAFTCCALPL
jgi:hypothetical protein